MVFGGGAVVAGGDVVPGDGTVVPVGGDVVAVGVLVDDPLGVVLVGPLGFAVVAGGRVVVCVTPPPAPDAFPEPVTLPAESSWNVESRHLPGWAGAVSN